MPLENILILEKYTPYEVDGFGNALFMDDANVPSLMSLAYIGGHTPFQCNL
jgi:meiotically up-regulated gene 157 (Mug157) protein